MRSLRPGVLGIGLSALLPLFPNGVTSELFGSGANPAASAGPSATAFPTPTGGSPLDSVLGLSIVPTKTAMPRSPAGNVPGETAGIGATGVLNATNATNATTATNNVTGGVSPVSGSLAPIGGSTMPPTGLGTATGLPIGTSGATGPGALETPSVPPGEMGIPSVPPEEVAPSGAMEEGLGGPDGGPGYSEPPPPPEYSTRPGGEGGGEFGGEEFTERPPDEEFAWGIGEEEKRTKAPYKPPKEEDPYDKPPDESEWSGETWKQETPEEMMHDKNVIIVVASIIGVAFVLLIFTAQQTIENPDGCCASICRCMVSAFCFVFKILCFPCRLCCGSKDRRTHDLVMSESGGYTHDLELT